MERARAVRLVTFDFWQTLFTETPEGRSRAHALRLSGVREALGRAGRRYDTAALEAADDRALAALAAVWRENRDVSPAEQVRVFLGALDSALPATLSATDWAAVEAAYATPVLTYEPVISPGAVRIVRELLGRGVRLGVISNTGRTPGTILRELLGRVGVLDAFEVLSFSDEVGIRKPAAEIFRRTLVRAGCDADAALHVGDDPVADVAGARAVSMRALHYVPDGRPGAPLADGAVRHFEELAVALDRLS